MRSVLFCTIVLASLVITGCNETPPVVLGHAPGGRQITTIASLQPSAKPQTIQGTMIDKCPVAGCWFHVKDSTGVVKVDTKSSGFVVAQVPLNTHVTVTGILHKDDDGTLTATGMSYR